MTRWRATAALAAAGAALALLLAVGPRNATLADGPPLPQPPLPVAVERLPAWLAAQEAAFTDIVPGAEKQIVFGPAGAQRAPWAVVYLHGFSATRQETAPLAEAVASALGAPLFATRFAGHGRGGAAMAEATLPAWKADALQALAIGRLLGERVLVIGVSTGATLAVWLAQQPEAAAGTAWVLVSPNFAPATASAALINAPWGRQIASALVGPEYGFTPDSADHARYWTTRYPTEALFPMMAAVDLAARQPLQRWNAPVLMLLSPRDRVIDTDAARAAFARIGSGLPTPAPKRLVEVLDATDPGQHVIAGRIKSPGSTATLQREIVGWVRALPR